MVRRDSVHKAVYIYIQQVFSHDLENNVRITQIWSAVEASGPRISPTSTTSQKNPSENEGG